MMHKVNTIGANSLSADWAEDAIRENSANHNHAAKDLRSITERDVLARLEGARTRKARIREDRITLAHGAGGKATHSLIEAMFLEGFRNPILEAMEDQAVLQVGDARLAFTTDSFVVSPLFFPGGGRVHPRGGISDW